MDWPIYSLHVGRNRLRNRLFLKLSEDYGGDVTDFEVSSFETPIIQLIAGTFFVVPLKWFE